MMPCKLHFIGVQLLLLAYTVQAFVLLTANIDDLKKLARKFVSDSMADKFADFVVKATEQMSDQIGGNNVKLQDISASNEHQFKNTEEKKQMRTTRRHRQEYDARTTRNEERQKPNYLTNESQEMSVERDERQLDNEKKWEKSSQEIGSEAEQEKKSDPKYWREKLKKNKEQPQDDWLMENNELKDMSKESPKHSYVSQYANQDKEIDHPSKQFQSYYKSSHKDYAIPKPAKSQKSESKTADVRPESDETPPQISRYKKIKDRDAKALNFAFKSPFAEKLEKKNEGTSSEVQSSLRYKKIKDHDSKMPAVHFVESNETKLDDAKLWKMETTRYRGLGRDDGVTTKKEKTDFDQYDNRNYPKAEFIATSGQLMLPRLPANLFKKETSQSSKTWWQKDIQLPNAAQLKSWLATV